MSVALRAPSQLFTDPSPETGLIMVDGVAWEQVALLQEVFVGRLYPRLTYLNGVLELMVPPSGAHENSKKTLAYLLETYFRHKNIRFYGRGSFRLEKSGYASGEPDESYCLGEYKEVPDLVIEVVVFSGTLNKLEIYKPHQIPEVWFYKHKRLSVFAFENGEYRQKESSDLLPALDLALLGECLTISDQYDAVERFRKALRGEQS
jgi:Uma2 family endonuclease